jgi:hypothetical protein
MTKRTAWILGIALACLVALGGAGCKKENPAQKVPTFNKQPVDMPALRKAVEPAGQEAQQAVRRIGLGLRYHRWDQAMEQLDKLKAMPNINDAAKKVIDEVAAQVAEAAKSEANKQPAQ